MAALVVVEVTWKSEKQREKWTASDIGDYLFSALSDCF